MSKIKYVLAKDEDFRKNETGDFTYIGKEPYVEIPHIIQGVLVKSYNSMFYMHAFVKGVKSTNKDIRSTRYMFSSCNRKKGTLDLSEFDMINVENASDMFTSSSFTNVLWPKDKMPLHLKNIDSMFFVFYTSVLDLSAFDFSKLNSSEHFLFGTRADKIIFPTKGFKRMVASGSPNVLERIKPHLQTEELCWEAVLLDKKEGSAAAVKSKKLLMYLGTDCPEYIDFYYNN